MAQSPTGRNPKLLWMPQRQDVWLQMKAEADAGADTLGARWYRHLVWQVSDPAPEYVDNGLRATLLYQITGDPSWIPYAWSKIEGFFARNLDNNFTREYAMEHVVLYDWLYPGLTQAQRDAFLTGLNREAAFILDNPSNPSFPIPSSDSDQTVGNYFALAFLMLATGDHNPQASTFFSHPSIGGLAATGSNRITSRNAVRQYVDMAAGGEWIESTEYNRGTVRLLLMGAEGVYTAAGWDYFPEVTAWLANAAKQPLAMATNDLQGRFQWGDNDHSSPRMFDAGNWVATAAMIAGLHPDPLLQDHILDVIEQYDADVLGHNVWPRTWYFFDPYAPRGSRFDASTSFFAPGQGLAIVRDSWGPDATTVYFHSRPNQEYVHHEVSMLGDIQIRRNGEWLLTHPLSYGGPSLYGEGTNTMVFGCFSAATEGRILAAQEHNSQYSYIASTTGGQIYTFSYYQPPPTFLHEWTRSLVYLPEERAVIIYDRCHAQDPRTLASFTRYRASGITKHQQALTAAPAIPMWHMHVEPNVAVDGGVATWQVGAQHLRLTQVHGEAVTSEVSQPYATDAKVKVSEKRTRLRLVPTQHHDWQTRLQVLEFGDEPISGTIVPISGTGLEGVRVGGKVLLFGSQPSAQLPAPVTISGVKQSAPTFDSTLRSGRMVPDGASATVEGGAQLLVFDLPVRSLATFIINGQAQNVNASDAGIAQFSIADTATITYGTAAVVTLTAPTNLRIERAFGVPPVSQVNFPSDDYVIRFSHDKVNLSGFGLSIDDGAFVALAVTEPTTGEFEADFPALTVGSHSLKVRAVHSSGVTSAPAEILVDVIITVSAVAGLRVERRVA